MGLNIDVFRAVFLLRIAPFFNKNLTLGWYFRCNSFII